MTGARKPYIGNAMAVTLKPTLAISHAQAQALVDRVAPGRSVLRLSAVLAGEIGAVFEIAFVDGPPLILKVYPEALHWKMRKEVRVASLLEGRLSVPTPRFLLADDSRTLIDLAVALMTRLEGQDVLRLEPELDRSQVLAIYGRMGRALREIHDVAMEAFGYIGPGGIVAPSATNRAYMLAQFGRKLGGFAAFGGNPELAKRLRDQVERSSHLLDGCRQPRLCHYDFHTGNVLAIGDRLTGIVDLENAIAGDPLMDLAKTIAYSVRDDDGKRAALLEGYGPIDRAGWQETVRLYQFYGAIELWAWWIQIGDKPRAASLLPDLERYAEA
jgi:aminoglycoside phosphotransferase (APT) family kinase protein